MATRQRAEKDMGYQGEALGEKTSGLHDESKWALLTTDTR